MKINKDKKVVKSIIIIIVFSICLGGIIWFFIHDSNQLKREPMFTKGVILEMFAGPKGGNNVRFEFYVNNTKYISSDGYSIKYDSFKIGDTCFVKYARSNPKNCRLVKTVINGNNVIKIKRLHPSVQPDAPLPGWNLYIK
jgi:hypothetical protein